MKPEPKGSLAGIAKLMAAVIGYGVIVALIPHDSILVLSIAVPPCVAAFYLSRSIRTKSRFSDIIAHGVTLLVLMVFSLYLAISFARREDDGDFALPLSMIIYPISALVAVPWFDRIIAFSIRTIRNEK